MYNNLKRNRALPISINVIILVAVSTAQLSSMVASNDNIAADPVYAKRHSTNFEQAASLVNDCSGDHESSIICVNNNPQTEGENNVVNTPINSLINNPVEEAPKQVLQVRQVAGSEITIPALGTATAVAECDADEFVTGGGFETDEIGSDIFLEGFGTIHEFAISGPPAGWFVRFGNPSTVSGSFHAVAECAKLVDAP
jgi:hypothetical protein